MYTNVSVLLDPNDKENTIDLLRDPRELSVGTHDKLFHADEVMACALLAQYYHLPVVIVRTRDPKILTWCDAVVDVGNVFDPEMMRFDHHQETYTGTRSSAGMVLDWLESKAYIDYDIADQLRYAYMDEIDAIDNGVYPGKPGTSFSNGIGALNHHDKDMQNLDPQHIRFEQAVKQVMFLLECLEPGYEQKMKDWEIVRPLVAKVQRTDEILELPEFLHWQAPVGSDDGQHINRVIWPETNGKGEEEWRVAVPNRPGSIPGKAANPYDLRPGTELPAYDRAKKFIPDLVFVHKNYFIGATSSRDTAYELANLIVDDEFPSQMDWRRNTNKTLTRKRRK